MSANVKAADLAITIVVTLLKAAGLGPEADRILGAIEGAKGCIGLIEDIMNETVRPQQGLDSITLQGDGRGGSQYQGRSQRSGTRKR